MRVTRVFVDGPLAAGAKVALPEDAAAYLLRVLRLRPGDACVLFNGDGHDYGARLLALDKRHAQVEVVDARPVANESPLRIVLLQGIARGEKMDLILQKATELGVARIAPVLTERTEVKLDAERAAKRMQHWRGVVLGACEQSGRARVPELLEPQPLAAYLAGEAPGHRFLLDPLAERSIARAGVLPGEALALLIGPEGGLSERDRLTARAAGFTGLRLGPRVLRTETAGLAAIAAFNAVFGDWR